LHRDLRGHRPPETGRAPFAAMVGVRKDEHAPARIVHDHLVKIAFVFGKQRADMTGLACIERTILEIKANDAGMRRNCVDALFAPSAEKMPRRGHYRFGFSNFGIGDGFTT
jgi:hypothetical protein